MYMFIGNSVSIYGLKLTLSIFESILLGNEMASLSQRPRYPPFHTSVYTMYLTYVETLYLSPGSSSSKKE